jgi:hypothetical protein
MPDAPEAQIPPPVSLTAEQAAILLKGDLRNLAKKVQQGKTLSASERNLLQSTLAGELPAAEEFAKNAVQLASILGVDRKTVQRWRKIDGNPGVRPDGRYHVPSWRAWKLARQGDGSEGEELSQSILRARQILLQNQKLEFQLAVLRREYVPASDVEKWGATLGSAIRKVIATLHLCAPSVVGLSVAEAEARLKEVEDEALQQLHLLNESIEHWQADTTAAVQE